MCLAVPGKIRELYHEHGMLMGKLDFGGVIKDACLVYVPNVSVGQYAIVHAGFAITVVDETSAQETLALFGQLESPPDNSDQT